MIKKFIPLLAQTFKSIIMKKTATFISLILSFVFTTPLFVQAGVGKFEGVITYNISISGPNLSAELTAMFPKTMTLTVKGSDSRNEAVSAMGTMVEITNYSKKLTITLMGMMGKKVAIKKTLDEVTKDMGNDPKPVVQMTGETKDIAGYKCKKAIITIDNKGKKITIDAWFTDELGGKELNWGNSVYRDIEGMLMEYSVVEQGMTMKYSAASVEKKAVSDSEFEIPADYTLTTEAELRSMFGGGM